MNKHIPTLTHMSNVNKIAEQTAIQNIKLELDNIFRNGIFDPTQVAYVHQLQKEYLRLSGKNYKLNKENSIV